MQGRAKTDLINKALSIGRISGVVVAATAEDLTEALDELENLMEELRAPNRGISLGYAFEDTPDLNTPHNIHRKYWNSIAAVLMGNLLPYFGKPMTPELQKRISAGNAFLFSSTTAIKPRQYPAGMPMGSKSPYGQFQQTFVPTIQAPSTDSNSMIIGEIEDFVEHFDAWLNDGETIASYTIVADDGLTIVSDSNTDEDVIYQIQADGSATESDDLLQVEITATSSDGRVKIRVINFALESVDVG